LAAGVYFKVPDCSLTGLIGAFIAFVLAIDILASAAPVSTYSLLLCSALTDIQASKFYSQYCQ
jgi:hypothetical protein